MLANVNNWETVDKNSGFKKLMKIIKEQHPDIVLLQNALWGKRVKTPNGFVLLDLPKKLRLQGYVNATALPKIQMGSAIIRGAPFGTVTLSKFPLAATPEVIIRGNGKGMFERGQSGGGGDKKVNALELHFKMPSGKIVKTVNVHSTGEVQEIMEELVTRFDKHGVDVIGTSSDGNQQSSTMEPFTAKFSSTFQERQPHFTYYDGSVRDGIFAKGDLKVTASQAYYSDASTHTPIFADIIF